MEDNFVDPEIFDAHPDYAVAVITISGIRGGPSNEHSEKLLLHAEGVTRALLIESPIDELNEVKSWRAAYESFGVKPRVARASFEALMRRIDKGLPRIDLLTDIYNAISIIHRVPIGGENFDAYVGAPRLVVAKGGEPFDTRENGEDTIHFVESGEVVWRDDLGVTCRRWNWRQCLRTRINFDSQNIIFIVESLDSESVSRANAAASHLKSEIQQIWPSAVIKLHLEHK